MSRNQRHVATGTVLLASAGLVFLGCSRAQDGDSPRGDATTDTTAQRQVFAVEGMTCEGCVGRVAEVLEGLPGVEAVRVSLADKQAVVEGPPDKVTEQAVITAIEEAGYEARPAPRDTSSPG